MSLTKLCICCKLLNALKLEQKQLQLIENQWRLPEYDGVVHPVIPRLLHASTHYKLTQ
jgi:hypothetical protein